MSLNVRKSGLTGVNSEYKQCPSAAGILAQGESIVLRLCLSGQIMAGHFSISIQNVKHI